MARRNPPPRPPRVRLGAVALALAFGAAVAVAPIVRAEPAPDLERARELYQSAEAAMQDGRYDDAARDYGAAYELSADPALFYKIGRASERAGKCDVALIYYARYLREGKPTEQFTALTRERMAACGGDRAGGGAGSGAAGPAGGAATGPAAGAGATAGGDTPGRGSSAGASPGPAGATQGSAASTSAGSPSSAGASPGPAGAAHGGPASPNAGSPPSGASPGNGGAAASTGAIGAGATTSPEGTGAGAAAGGSTAALIPPTREKVAWLMGGGAIALVALGGILAYAASSSENDVRDLYAGFAGQPPMFDAQTRKRYDDLVDQGRNYQHLSWAAFGLGSAAAIGTAVLFALGRGDEPGPPRAPAVTPVVGPRGAGVSVRF